MMKTKITVLGILACGGLFWVSSALAQGPGRGITAGDPKNANKPYDKHDISGIWTRNGTPGGYGGGGTCRDCGDRGFSNDVPPLTPLGQKMFDANKPSYGRLLSSADASAHPEEAIGRRRSPARARRNYSRLYARHEELARHLGLTKVSAYPPI